MGPFGGETPSADYNYQEWMALFTESIAESIIGQKINENCQDEEK